MPRTPKRTTPPKIIGYVYADADGHNVSDLLKTRAQAETEAKGYLEINDDATEQHIYAVVPVARVVAQREPTLVVVPWA